MKAFFLLFVLIFIIVGIVKSKNKDYLRLSGISLITIFTLNALSLSNHQPVNNAYLVFFYLSDEQVDLLIQFSIGLALVGLIMYIYSDYKE
ncbi:hypothetical protein [Bacillus sp. SM2101]|uniref:hypothetical protein n=1 Tax=Bacillaceae TaxID=186817 RepID=UPI001BDE0469|nr:hypothetical protein [Bacillus sp. SM2101]